MMCVCPAVWLVCGCPAVCLAGGRRGAGDQGAGQRRRPPSPRPHLTHAPHPRSRERPHPRVFCPYVFTSLLGQFAVHMTLLVRMQGRAHALMPEVRLQGGGGRGGRRWRGEGSEREGKGEGQGQQDTARAAVSPFTPVRLGTPMRAQGERQAPDAEFKPNLLNTVCFLVNFAIQVGGCTRGLGARACRGCSTASACVRLPAAPPPHTEPPPLCLPPHTHTLALPKHAHPTSKHTLTPMRPVCRQTMTFAVNYVGAPFNTPLRENKAFAASVQWSAALFVLLVLDLPPGAWWWGRGACARLPRAVAQGGREGGRGAEKAGRERPPPAAARCLACSALVPSPPTPPAPPPPAGLRAWFSLVHIPWDLAA